MKILKINIYSNFWRAMLVVMSTKEKLEEYHRSNPVLFDTLGGIMSNMIPTVIIAIIVGYSSLFMTNRDYVEFIKYLRYEINIPIAHIGGQRWATNTDEKQKKRKNMIEELDRYVYDYTNILCVIRLRGQIRALCMTFNGIYPYRSIIVKIDENQIEHSSGCAWVPMTVTREGDERHYILGIEQKPKEKRTHVLCGEWTGFLKNTERNEITFRFRNRFNIMNYFHHGFDLK
jgi:hypothetical protein